MVETKPESSSPLTPAGTWVVVLVTLLVRLAILFSRQDALARDPDSYREIANNLLSQGTFGHARPPGSLISPVAFGKGLEAEQHSYPLAEDPVSPTAHRPPLYPLLLVPAVLLGAWSAAGIAALHLALGLATVWLVWKLAADWGLSPLGALATAGLVACDPILLNQSAEVMTETAATFIAVALLRAGTRVWRDTHSRSAAAWAGAVAGLAILCRPTFLPAALCGFAFWVAVPRHLGRRCGLYYLLAMGAVLSPWAVRNQLVFGWPIVTTTHGGHTLRLANNPQYYAHIRTSGFGVVWDSQELERVYVSEDEARTKEVSREVILDDANYDLAEGAIRQDPSGFGRATIDRLVKTWRLVPAERPSESGLRSMLRRGVGLWYLVEYLLVAVGLWTLGRRVIIPPWLFGMLLIVTFTLAHAVYWTDMRMRAPLVPVICLLASVGIERVLSKARSAPHADGSIG